MVNSRITISTELRPCMIGDKKALFHRWYQRYNTVGAEITIGGAPGGQIGDAYGLVEFEDGSVKSVKPEKIRFLDNPFAEYDFSERSGEDGA